MTKSHKNSPSMADYGDGGSNRGAGKAASVHGGGKKLDARPVTPSGPSGATHPRSFGGHAGIVQRPTPMTKKGAGSPEGAPTGTSSGAGERTSGASTTDDGAL